MFNKKTKIICTIGPSSWDPEVMKQMIENGMNCARVNGAFADPAELDKVANLVRSVSNEVSLMVDVKGPEIRLNKFPEPVKLEVGMEIVIGNTSEDAIYPANYNDVYTFLNPGQKILIGDGDVELKVKEIRDQKIFTEVVSGQLLKPGKALNLPGINYSTTVLTEKDIENLKHAVATGWDFVSASFMKNAESAREVKKYLEGSHMKLIAKIEDEEGVNNIDEILKEVEGIMIARGGLGIELGLERVPIIQRLLIKKCNEVGKPVITATQMLESMHNNPKPTRAEVNDVATAIFLGSDAVMLSGESSAGSYPVEAVKELSTIALEVEKYMEPCIMETKALGFSATDAISKAAAKMCIEMSDEISKVLIVSRTGRTARLVGRHWVKQPIYAFLSKDYYVRRMMLSKGINRAYVLENKSSDRDQSIIDITEYAKSLGIVKTGEKIMLLCKNPLDNAEIYFPNIFEVIEVK